MYLGCESPASLLATEGREVDYKAVEREQHAIDARILQASTATSAQDSTLHCLRIECECGAVAVRGDGRELDSRSCVMQMRISWPGAQPLQTAVVCIGCPSPIYATPSQFTIEGVGQEFVDLPFHVFSDGSGAVPHCTTVDIAASYTPPPPNP